MQVCHDAVQLRHELVTSDMNVALRRSDQRLILQFSNSLCAQNYQLPITNYQLPPHSCHSNSNSPIATVSPS